MIIVLRIIWLILPAGIANITAALSAIVLPRLNYPIDFYKQTGGKRIFGNNKTWRGLISGTAAGEIIFLLQKNFFDAHPFFNDISLFNYQDMHWSIGFLFGFGALFGDLIKSFIKRRLGIASGKSWFVFDQIDWILGLLLIIYPFIKLPISIVIMILCIGFLLHIIIKFFGYLARINKVPLL
ncbi:MAG: CDP-archaeol synthase [Patescibacteria group bacterium]